MKPGGSFDILEKVSTFNDGVEDACEKGAYHSIVLSTRKVIATYWTGLRVAKGKGMTVLGT